MLRWSRKGGDSGADRNSLVGLVGELASVAAGEGRRGIREEEGDDMKYAWWRWWGQFRFWFRWAVIGALWRIGHVFGDAGTSLMDRGWMR